MENEVFIKSLEEQVIGWVSRNDSQTKKQNWLMSRANGEPQLGKVEKQEASVQLLNSATHHHASDPKIRKLRAQLPELVTEC